MKNRAVKRNALLLVGRQVHAGLVQLAVVEHLVVTGVGGFCVVFVAVRLAEHFRQLLFEPFNKQFYVAHDALRICHIYIV